MKKVTEKRKIGQIIQRYLLRISIIVFIIAISTGILQSMLYSKEYSFHMLEEYVRDVTEEADDEFHQMIMDATASLSEMIESKRDYISDEWLADLVEFNPSIVSEINIVDIDGIVQYSNIPKYVGYDMHSGEDASEFLCLLNGTEYYEQGFLRRSYADSIEMAYAGRAFSDGSGFVEIGISINQYYALLEKELADEVRHRRIGLIGYLAVLNKDYKCIGSTEDAFVGRQFEKTSLLPDKEGEYKRGRASFNGEDSYLVSVMKGGYYILGAFPVIESKLFGLAVIAMIVFILIATLVAMFISIRKHLDISVVKPIDEIYRSLLKITGGDLEEKVSVHDSLEFEELSNGINQTVDRLKDMIEEEAKRTSEELEMARVIQNTSLPNIFPPYPSRKDIGLYATMNAAKQVGGDFYDFYMVNKNMLAVVIADVADKGIPAALFMMKAKTVLKSYAVSGKSVDEVVSMTNEELVKDNANMFVTLWIGFINLETGLIQYVHAGHTYPFVIRGKEALRIKQKRNFVVGGKSGAKFLKQEYQLLPGDILYLYTDGVTETINKDGEEYEERLAKSLLYSTNDKECDDANELCRYVCTEVLKDVRAFANGAEQFDDITMLCFNYQPDKQD